MVPLPHLAPPFPPPPRLPFTIRVCRGCEAWQVEYPTGLPLPLVAAAVRDHLAECAAPGDYPSVPVVDDGDAPPTFAERLAAARDRAQANPAQIGGRPQHPPQA